MYDKKIQWIFDFVDTILSIARMIGLTHFRGTMSIAKRHDKCVIMGSGPSLIESLNVNKSHLADCDFIAVNLMALTSLYIEYKPSVYVLCDPGFWLVQNNKFIHETVQKTYQIMIEKTDWNLQLYLPYQAKETKVKKFLSTNKNINLCFYNKTKFEGYKWLSYWVYNRQWGMPRAQNVLHAALMVAIHSRYKDIYLAGADNDWIKTVWVDEENRIRYGESHFYKESGSKDNLVSSLKIYEPMLTLYYTFKSYWVIKYFAKEKDINIYNLGQFSFIDAYKKTRYI